MHRGLPLIVVLAACASAPSPKQSWDAAPVAHEVEADEEPAPVADPGAEARMRVASPLAQGTARFAGIEQVLRSRFGGKAMPDDGRAAWGGMLALIDRSVQGTSPATREDLLRARADTDGELTLDRQAYGGLPAGLDTSVHVRIAALTARLAAQHRAKPQSPSLTWPLWPAVVTSLFGSRPDPFDRQSWKTHQGIDLSAPAGTLVTTAGAGVVVDCGWRQGYGLLVAVRHPDGTVTRYGHLSHVLTRQGLEVSQGDPIGLVGATGRATGPHLHFEIWRHGEALDPLIELGDPEVDLPEAVSER